MSKPKVLITGITGYIGTHLLKALIEDGSYDIRGTGQSNQSFSKLDYLRAILKEKLSEVELVAMDLLKPDQIEEVVQGCQYILHCASPFPNAIPKDENSVIRPAVEGTLHLLRAAVKHNVKRVVLTSSLSSVVYQKKKKQFYTEQDFSDPKECSPYEKSKTLQERAAWDYLKSIKGQKPDLVVLNGGHAFGPNLITSYFTLSKFITTCLSGMIPGVPKIQVPVVDVRDFAQAHLKALTCEEAANQRFLVVNRALWLKDVMDIVKKRYGKYYSVPNRDIGYIPYKVLSTIDSHMKLALPWWDVVQRYDNTKSKEVLGVQYRPVEDSVLDMTQALIDTGFLPNKLPAAKL